ncbi:gliding motility protein GldN [Siphonobacter curvatus]|uniref:Gliding motility protein GldN n=2 Tax=Siphonobacter curvatus TaxID=2094562 RepID=A0A2S7IKN7_9BACT|nr:gliding motility protein GldN [Siphonobacter curvatus]
MEKTHFAMTKLRGFAGLTLSLVVAGSVYAQEPTPMPEQAPPANLQAAPTNTQPRVLGAEQRAPMNDQRTAMAERNRASESLRPIDDEDIMYKTTLWRRMDLQETQNQPFFSTNNEITRYLIDGMKAGVLKAYKNDSLVTELTPEQFQTNLRMEGTGAGLSDEEKAAGFGDPAPAGDDGWGDSAKKKDTKKPAAPAAGGVDDGWGGTTGAKKDTSGFDQPSYADDNSAYEYFPTDITVLELKEDYVFDKRRSRQYYDMKSITLIIPAAKTSTGLDREVASFRYKDVDQYFRSNPKKFIWYNNQNNAKHLNMADAFDLRLFSSRILKQSNSKNAYLSQIYGGEKEGLVKAQQLEYKLMEWEHNLWEY